MLLEIKNKIEREIANYIGSVDKLYSLSRISPVLFKHIREFISRKGKRIRPTLFAIAYLGFSRRPAPGLYRSAVSLELLHDFMLVHDDIIDKTATRRGRPSMHTMLSRYLAGRGNLKFNGEDLTIVIGDVMFAMALEAFLGIKEDLKRKERGRKKLIQAALYTGSGEFLELLNGIKHLDRLSLGAIYKIYDLKTANYTFAAPLAIGSTIAGADKTETAKLFRAGIYLGRAFQIQDDILGMFADEKQTGKSALTDLKEAKKTVLIWHAFRHSSQKDKTAIKQALAKKNAKRQDLLKMRKIITKAGSLEFARKEILRSANRAQALLGSSRMKLRYKNLLELYAGKILNT